MTDGGCIVLTTTASDECAQRIIDRLLSDRLAACVQVLPIRSHYVWKGSVQNEAEQLLLIKAKSSDWQALEAAIAATHDYETPEIIRIDMADVSSAYFAWMLSVTR